MAASKMTCWYGLAAAARAAAASRWSFAGSGRYDTITVDRYGCHGDHLGPQSRRPHEQ